MDVSEDAENAKNGFRDFFASYNDVADQWNEFCARKIACKSGFIMVHVVQFYHAKRLSTVLPVPKDLNSTLSQDNTGRPPFPIDLDVEMETLANIRILLKTFMENLWREFLIPFKHNIAHC